MCPINQANAVASAPTVTGPVLPRDSDYFWDSVQNRNSFAVFESDRNSVNNARLCAHKKYFILLKKFILYMLLLFLVKARFAIHFLPGNLLPILPNLNCWGCWLSSGCINPAERGWTISSPIDIDSCSCCWLLNCCSSCWGCGSRSAAVICCCGGRGSSSSLEVTASWDDWGKARLSPNSAASMAEESSSLANSSREF